MEHIAHVGSEATGVAGRGRMFRALSLGLALLLLGACAQPGTGGEGNLDPFYLDTYRPSGTPTATGPVLAAGVRYVVVVQGTHSSWGWHEWDLGVCRGEAGDEPLFPSPGVQNGRVGMDAAWVFAVPNGSSRCGNTVPFRGSAVRISLDGGGTFQDLGPLTGGTGPTADHSYEYEVTGQGKALVLNRGSGNSSNNYGRLRIEVSRAD